ncbi:MAG: hypothetical protein ACK2T6_07470 [Anaerolineae bacterium]
MTAGVEAAAPTAMAGLAAWAVYLLLLALPGAALLSLLPRAPRDPVTAAGLILGLGFAAYPLLFLWAHVAGVRLGPLLLSVFLAISAAVALYRHRSARWWRVAGARVPGFGAAVRAAPDDELGEPEEGGQSDAIAWLTASCVFAAVLVSRWYAVHDVSVPLWGDSLHHTMIVRLLVTSGGLVDSWEPLVPLASFTYHFGLHSTVASLVWLTSLPEHQALLVAGQVLSAIQVLTAYALVAGMTRRPWAGVGAAIAVGGLSPMPAYYVNWGRYTQLAGQVLLPAVALLSVWAADELAWLPTPLQRPARARAGALATIGVASLVLTHYLVALMFALFAVAWLLVMPSLADRNGAGPRGEPVPREDVVRRGAIARGRALLRLAAVAAGATVLTLPWLLRLSDSIIGRAAAEMVSGGLQDADVYGVVSAASVWGSYSVLLGTAMIVVAALAAAWGVARRERTVWLGLVWAALLLASAYVGALGVPVTSPLKDFTVAIGLYLPASLVVGGALGDLMSFPRASRRAVVRAVAGAALVVAATLAWKDRDPITDEHVLVTPADERAMEWLRDETPTDALILASCLKAFGGTICAGDDAGWWIPLLAGRETTVPPVTYGVETTAEPGYAASVNRLADLWHADLNAPETRAALDELGVTHAYLGAVVSDLDRTAIADSPYWRLMYDSDGVQVYERVHVGGATSSPRSQP